ncbi:TIR domain-containing protein [Streptomyces sp. NB004]
MPLPRAFLSFDFDHDLTAKSLFAGQAKTDSPTPFQLADWSSKNALPQSQWERIIEDKISRCHLLIVLVGNNMATATGVAKEIAMARRDGLPCFGVYVNGASARSALPNGLPRNSVVSWKWGDIASMINKCSNLGKNSSVSGWPTL